MERYVGQCVEVLVVNGICGNESGEEIGVTAASLHECMFDRFTALLDYETEAEGIDAELMSERNARGLCSVYGHTNDNYHLEASCSCVESTERLRARM